MSSWQPEKQVVQVRALPLTEVLVWCGAQRDRIDKKKWKTSVGSISISGTKFMNWSQGVGGGGAIDLVMHLKGLDFKTAVGWLGQHLGGRSSWVIDPPKPKALQLPSPDSSRLRRVKNYLLLERQLPAALLEPLIENGAIYADKNANAVFLLRDDQQQVVGAELRGTGGRWRGLAPGTRKDQGFFSVSVGQPPGSLILCESAIDAISCLVLHPGHLCVSTAGARPNPPWLELLLDQGREIWCGYDNDRAGEQMAAVMIALHPAIKRLRPQAHDWNEQLKVCSRSKQNLLLLGKKI